MAFYLHFIMYEYLIYLIEMMHRCYNFNFLQNYFFNVVHTFLGKYDVRCEKKKELVCILPCYPPLCTNIYYYRQWLACKNQPIQLLLCWWLVLFI